MKKKNKKGFTVVELIAVIVLLAIVVLIAIASMSSINENTKKKQRKNKLNAIKVAATNYLNDTGTYKVYVDTLVNQGYLEYDKLEGMKKLVIDPLDETKIFNCYYAEMNVDNNEVTLSESEANECKEEIQINTDVGIKYCIDNDGTCEPDKDDFTGWRSTDGKTKVVLGGSFSNENLNDGKYTWTTPSAPDLGQTTERYIIDLPDGTYVNEMYRLTVTKGGKNYNGSAIVKIDNARPKASLSVKCESNKYGNGTDSDSWCNEKTIIANLSDKGAGLSAYKVVTNLDDCNNNNGWVDLKGAATYELRYKIDKNRINNNINSQSYYVCVRDLVGNTNINDQTNRIEIKNVDVEKPTCNISKPSPNGINSWYISNVSLSMSTSDVGSGVKNKGLAANSSTLNGLTSGTQSSQTGGTTWYGKVIDNVGNEGICDSGTIKLDLQNPSVSTFSVSSTKSYNSIYAKTTVTGTDNMSQPYQYCFNTTNNSSSCSWKSSINNMTFTVNGTEGSGQTYTYYAFVKDTSGRISAVKTITYKLYTRCSSSYISSYGSWGSCSAKCNGGTKYRTEYRTDSYLGGSCPSTTGSTSCNTMSCCSSTYTSYGSWGSCSKSCGGGTQSRTIYKYSNYDDRLCSTSSGSQSCNTMSCCSSTYESCGSWGSCSKSCGGGKKKRTCKDISNYNGSTCSSSTESKSCNTQACSSGGSSCTNPCPNGGTYKKVNGTPTCWQSPYPVSPWCPSGWSHAVDGGSCSQGAACDAG